MPSTRAGCRLLLIAIALQGLTPDPRDLASAWLLGFLVPETAPSRPVDSGPVPSPTRLPVGQDDGGLGELCVKPEPASGSRARIEGDGHLPPVVAVARFEPGASSPRLPLRPPSVLDRWADGLLPYLCRFLC